MKSQYDVLIIGGGPAGLSAALTLGRVLQSVLLVDANQPRNIRSSHVNNFPTQDGIHPEEWRQKARADLNKYQTIETFSGSVVALRPAQNHFRAELHSGEEITVRKVILAHGVRDRHLPVPGFAELFCWRQLRELLLGLGPCRKYWRRILSHEAFWPGKSGC